MKKILLIALLGSLSIGVKAQTAYLYNIPSSTNCTYTFRFIAYDKSCNVLDYSTSYSGGGGASLYNFYDLTDLSTVITPPGVTATNVTWTSGVPAANSWGVELSISGCTPITYSVCNLGTNYCNNCIPVCCATTGADWGDSGPGQVHGFLNVKD